MKQLPQLLLKLTVLAVYTVASLTVGLFHNHNAHTSCGCCDHHATSVAPGQNCEQGQCRLDSQEHAHGHTHSHKHAHHHGHEDQGHDHHAAAHAESATGAEDGKSEHSGHPGHCDDCAACQFLAAVPPLVEIATFTAVEYHQPFVSAPLAVLDGQKLPQLHFARGPP